MKITLLQIHFHSLVHKDHITINLVQIWQFSTIALKEVFPPKFKQLKMKMIRVSGFLRFLDTVTNGYQKNVEIKSSRRRLLRYFHFSINMRNLDSFREFISEKEIHCLKQKYIRILTHTQNNTRIHFLTQVVNSRLIYELNL
jgi:hypothetical protein